MKAIIRAMLGMAMIGVAANSYAVPAGTSVTNGTLTPSLEVAAASCIVDISNNTTIKVGQPVVGSRLVRTPIGTVTVTQCATDYTLGADTGVLANYNTSRHLAHGTDLIAYNLDIALTGGATVVNWGNTGMTTLGTQFPLTTHGELTFDRLGATPANPDVYIITMNANVPVTAPVGVYTDTVNVTVAF